MKLVEEGERKGKVGVGLVVGTLGKLEWANMMERRKMNIRSVEEARWKEKKACGLGAGSSCFIMVWVERGHILEVKRVSG